MIFNFSKNGLTQQKNFGKVFFRKILPREASQSFSAGFTIMETIVVIAVTAILVWAVVLTFEYFRPALQLSGTARNLVSDLYYAQELSVSEQINHGVYFSTSTDRDKYEIVKYEDGSTTSIKEIVLPDGIKFREMTDYQIIFNPYGAAEEEAIVTLGNIKNETKTIRVGPSGFVKIIRPE